MVPQIELGPSLNKFDNQLKGMIGMSNKSHMEGLGNLKIETTRSEEANRDDLETSVVARNIHKTE